MKKNLFYILLLLIGFGSSRVKGQMSSNTVNYKVSYDISSQSYTVWVVPNYSTPNSNNLDATEKGATAQVTLRVPNSFVIANITNVVGTWDTNPLKLGPNQQSQLAGQGLDASKAYYVIGKGSSETDYGQFISGTPVALFTFTGNGCFGPIEILTKTDPVVSVADSQLSLNLAPSFYSRSGQPAGGNQDPLEQYNAPSAGPASCFEAINDTYTATTGTPATQNVLSNDGFNGGVPTASDVNVTVPTQPANGTATVNPDGTITYTPTPGFTGTDTYTYQVCDKANPTVCDVATVTITVNCPVLTAPTGLSANPNPVCAGSPTTLSGSCATGTITWYSDAALTTTVTSPVSPATTTTYYAACVNGTCKSPETTLIVNVSALPATPMPNPATVSNVCPALTIDLTSTLGTPPAGVSYEWHNANNTLAASLVATPTAVATAGTYYVFAKNSTGCYSATSGSVAATLTPCILANPNSTSTTLNTLVTIPVLANDTNNGATATLSNVTLPTISTPSPNGTATVKADGTIDFTPTTGFVGTATFIYQLCDKVQTTVCDTALVTINVTCPVMTAPTSAMASPSAICSGSSSTLSATCTTGTLTWYSDAGLTTVLTTSTVSPTTTTTYYAACVSATCKSPAANVVVTVTNCKIIYAYNDNNITPVNTSVGGNVLTNDDLNNGVGPLVVATSPVSQPTNGTVTLSANGTYTYIPAPNFVGNDSFKYRVCDTSTPVVCDTATVFIDVYASVSPTTNNPPIAIDDINTTTKNSPVSGNVLSNDKDPDAGQTLTATKLTGPTHGTVVFNPDGTYSYTPTPGYVGDDSFTYQVCDNGTPQLCDVATVQIVVKDTPTPGTNLPPVAGDDLGTTPSGTPVTGNVLSNDKDPEGGILTVTTTPVTNPMHGTVVINPDGTYSYTPTPGYVGSDKFVYEVCDNGTPKECTQATVYLQVTASKVSLLPKAYLQGALFGVTGSNWMRDDLRVKGLLPAASPYPAMGLTALTPTGNVATSVFTITGADAIVDWVFVELRDASNNQQVVDSRSALIQRDGDIVDIDGTSALTFTSAQPGNYYVVVKHRNHLGVMSKTALPLSATTTTVDFRQASTPTYTLSTGITDQAQVVVEQGVAMWAGNSLYDNKVIYQGTANDVNPIYQLIINASGNVFVTPYYKLKSYNTGDINLNGETIFQGTGNDVEFIYQNVIKNHPGNVLKQNYFVIKEQLP